MMLMKQLLKIFSLTSVLLTILAGCETLLPQSETNPCTAEGVLFVDEFKPDQKCGWVEYQRSGAIVQVMAEGEVLQISTTQPGQLWWSNPGRNFTDTQITVETRQMGGPDDNAYGVICRYQNIDNYYVFLISGDGYYTIGKLQSGSPQIIFLTSSGEYVYSDVINQGVAMNNIQVSCVGNQLSMTVNGVLLETVVDDSFAQGDVGLGLTTFQPGTAIVQFDNVQVVAP